jgi:tRNA pseudouridine38-40 synthase
MYNHRLTISYKGTHYFGWQDLGTGQLKITIQSCIQKVLDKICKYQNCTISVSSRTDAGVHAQGQVIKISIPLLIESKKLQLGMNSLLPEDIRILHCSPCDSKFNPNKDSKSKEYHYYFCSDSVYNPIFNDTITHIHFNNKENISESLDIELMQKACNVFIGEHDFYSFAKRDITMNSTFRTIISCEILKALPLSFSNTIYYVKIVGESFLRYMVRYIAGALFEIGKNKLSIDDISDALVNPKNDKISSRAKSKGLHLIQISY